MRTAHVLTVSPSMYLAPGGGVCSRGCTWSQGGMSAPGGCTWSRGGVCSWGGVSAPRGVYLVPGVSAPGGLHLVLRGGLLPPVNRMTNRCKNITLPQTSFAGGN